MPISDPRDRLFYPHHTHMKDTYILYFSAQAYVAILHKNRLVKMVLMKSHNIIYMEKYRKLLLNLSLLPVIP